MHGEASGETLAPDLYGGLCIVLVAVTISDMKAARSEYDVSPVRSDEYLCAVADTS